MGRVGWVSSAMMRGHCHTAKIYRQTLMSLRSRLSASQFFKLIVAKDELTGKSAFILALLGATVKSVVKIKWITDPRLGLGAEQLVDVLMAKSEEGGAALCRRYGLVEMK